MAEKRKLAEQDYLEGMKYKDIASKYDVSINTVKSWKQRHGWSREKGAHKVSRVHTNPVGAPKGNKNAVGNRGGSAPKGNSNAVTHGFFRKHLPPEAFDIMSEIAQKNPLDMLWENITIQYTAIIRAQRIMYVEDRDDKTTSQVGYTDGEKSQSERWEVQYAWDKQANFLQAQSRAMSTLQGMIRQYEELCRTDLATEEQRLRVEKLKAEVKVLSDPDINNDLTIIVDYGDDDDNG